MFPYLYLYRCYSHQRTVRKVKFTNMASVAVKSEDEANVEVNVEEKILELLKESPQGISDKVNVLYDTKFVKIFYMN